MLQDVERDITAQAYDEAWMFLNRAVPLSSHVPISDLPLIQQLFETV